MSRRPYTICGNVAREDTKRSAFGMQMDLMDLNKFARYKNKPLLEAEFARIVSLHERLMIPVGIGEHGDLIRYLGDVNSLTID